MPIRVADYIARTLAARGVAHAFLVTGGGAMHLNDAFGREKGLEWVAFHHEQACAMAADVEYTVSRRPLNSRSSSSRRAGFLSNTCTRARMPTAICAAL